MKRLIVALVVILVLAAGGYGWYAWSHPPADTVPTTVAVGRGTVEKTVLATGIIEASSLVSVGAQASGSIESLEVKLGDDVAAGDLIATIDSLDQENAVRSAEASLANINAQRAVQDATLKQAQLALERAEKLAPQKLVSDADYQAAQLSVDTAKGQLAAIDAQIEQAEINVDTAKLSLERTKITAPSSGTVVAVLVEVGQSINANNDAPTIVKIANLDKMVVKAEISEADVPQVAAGQDVYFTILGDPDKRIDATLRDVEPAPESIETDSASTSSGDAIYYNGLFDVDNPDHRLRISMTAQVTIILDKAENALTVPASVLTRKGRDGGYMIRVWDPVTEEIAPRQVEIGLNDNLNAVVLSGLEEGDLVVTGTAAGSGAGAGARSNQDRGGGMGPMGGGFGGGRGPRF